MRRTPRDTEISARRITRRGLVLGVSQVALIGVLGLRMRQMQVEEADEFRLLAEENRINLRLIPPARGMIFDRDGRVIADNAQNYRVVIVREDAGDVEDVLTRLSGLIALPEEDKERVLREVNRRSPFVPVTVLDRLSWEDFSRVAVNAPALPGISTEVGLSRFYPRGEDFAHLAGYVGPVSDYDLSKIENPDPLLQIPKFQIGKNGVEAKLEQSLRGSAGTKRIEVNAGGRVMRELSRINGVAGDDIQLTIDAKLQNFTQARLGEESASAVVMDCETGDVLACVSSPSFDPNKFVRGISVADYRELTENDHVPLANKSVQGLYPPGSTYKMVTALAALEAGVVGYDETVWCPGHLQLGNRRFHCWKRGGHGHVDLHNSLKQSCDVYYYDISQRVGIDKMAEMSVKLGLGQRFDLPMSAVKPGIIPNKAWKLGRYGEDWRVGDTLNSSIGQGYVLSSPLQLAVMSARIGTGRAVEPRLVKSVNGRETPVVEAPPVDVNPRHLRAIREAMYAVSNNQRGTAYRSRIVEEGFKLAGKTGTSQVRNITKAERAAGVWRNEDLPWHRRDHALFVAYAPHDTPKYAISVVVEHGGGGSKAAAPVARDILLHALYGEMPPLDAYPRGQHTEIEERMRGLDLRQDDPEGPTNGRSRA